MDIKRVDDRPVVIHTKEKPRLHVKGAPETKIRGSALRQGPETAGTVPGGSTAADGKIKQKSPAHVMDKSQTGQAKAAAGGMEARERNQKGGSGQSRDGTVPGRTAKGSAQAGNTGSGPQGRQGNGQGAWQPGNTAGRMYSRHRMAEAQREAAIKKKSPLAAAVVSAAARAASDETEGGAELHDAYRTAAMLAKPAAAAADAGRKRFRSQTAEIKQRKIRQRQPGSIIRGATVAGNVAKAARKPDGPPWIKAAKRGAAMAGAGGAAAWGAPDKRSVKHSTKSRMISLFLAKRGQGKTRGSFGEASGDTRLSRFPMVAGHILRYPGMALLPALFAAVLLTALPAIAALAVIYNSPFAVFFPSISSGETAREVLSAYMSDFNGAVSAELADHAGYDESGKIYAGFEGSGTPDNFYDILMVYMVKYGTGDAATDMTDQARQNLKAVFDDMCSYTVSGRADTDSGGEGGSARRVKEVRVELKSCHDMAAIYGFDGQQKETLAQLMDPEYLAMIGYTGGRPGESIPPEQYRAIVDAISDENGRKVVAFALSKVGYPYSQAYRDSGDYFDCSSLAWYAWRSAGVNIAYGGVNTAACEGKFCYDNNLLVDYDEMQPGDLIFYSYERNGQFMDISHVAVYVGDGNAVEAASTELGVIYGPVQGRPSIVFIGRPR